MKFKSNLVAQASGALGGKVASRNKGGEYFRRRALPTNPRTPLQVAIRTGFGTLSQFYGQKLTDAQRTAWTQYGANVLIIDRLGDARQQSGISSYNRSNTARVQAGLPVINNAPTVFALGTTPLYDVSLTSGGGGPDLQITLRNPDQYAATDQILIYVGRPKGAGVAFFKGPYRFAGNFAGDDGPSLVLPFDQLPFVYANGQRLFVRLTASMTDGRYSTPGDTSILLSGLTGAAAAAAAPAATAAGEPAAAAKEKRARLRPAQPE